MENFCDRCMQSKPTPRQQTWWVSGKAFCKTSCLAYLAELQAERERKYNEFIVPYLAKKAEWDAKKAEYDALLRRFDVV